MAESGSPLCLPTFQLTVSHKPYTNLLQRGVTTCCIEREQPQLGETLSWAQRNDQEWHAGKRAVPTTKNVIFRPRRGQAPPYHVSHRCGHELHHDHQLGPPGLEVGGVVLHHIGGSVVRQGHNLLTTARGWHPSQANNEAARRVWELAFDSCLLPANRAMRV